MALISNGIDSVRAFELPCGIWADGEYVAAGQTALVKWRSVLSDKFHQVYVNGRFAGATLDAQQREMIVPIQASFESAVRIEVFAVDAERAHADLRHELVRPPVDGGRVRISLLRSQKLPIGAAAEIYFDNGTGQIDYDKPLSDSSIRIWPAWQDKAGFGMSKFGAGDFGYDSTAAVGFGKGAFGHGQFGLDAEVIEWTSPPMPAGVYKFGVKVTDKLGNKSSASQTEQITVTPAARPAERMRVSSFDEQANELVLEIENL